MVGGSFVFCFSKVHKGAFKHFLPGVSGCSTFAQKPRGAFNKFFSWGVWHFQPLVPGCLVALLV